MASTSKPIFLMTCAFVESLFASPAQAITTTDMPGIKLLPSQHKVLTWGTGDEPITRVTMDDAAGYTICDIERPDADTGCGYRLKSFAYPLKEMIRIYREVAGIDMKLRILVGLDDLAKTVA